MNGIDIAETLNGKIEDIVFRNEENDYTVLEVLADDGRLVTAVGIIASPGEGEIVSLVGHTSYHKEFGAQFAFTSYEKTLPKEIDGIIQYLSSRTVKGIGPVTALKIVNKFGTETFDVIENHPEWLTDIQGITPKKAKAISESFRSQDELRGVMMFFKDYIGTGEVNKVYKRFGASAVGMVKENPYILCRAELGIPFDKADSMAFAFGYPKDGSERVIAGIEHILERMAAVNGHTCLPIDELTDAASRLLGIERDALLDMISHLVEREELCEYRTAGTVYIMTPETAEAEQTVAKRLCAMTREIVRLGGGDIAELVRKAEAEMRVTYAERQREAIYRSLSDGAAIITGGPGTGKTTIVKAMISVFRGLGMKTVLAAPTGRAAKRMSEATGREAKTIHRLLEMERTENDRVRFNRNARSPIEEDVVIIDEASMVDLPLMAALVRALKRGARLILIGDFDQLPSVGAGNVLSDLIASEVIPTVRLTEVFRQSEESLIITNAHKINNGEMPILGATDRDFFFVRREDERSIADAVATLITERLPRAYGSSIKADIQVITPSRRGWGGVEVLNRELQERINPPAPMKKQHTAHSTAFRVGDRVMQTVNDYEIEWEKNGIEGLGIFNGDIGVINNIYPSEKYIEISFDDRVVKYPYDKLEELELAYAITVHKSQGSEYPVVIIPMYSCPPMLMTRNLLYTAVTRARRMVILVGRSDVPGRMVANNREIKRYTTLAERLSREASGR